MPSSAAQAHFDTLEANGSRYRYVSLAAAGRAGLGPIERLPYSIKVLLESLLRHGDMDGARAVAAWLERRTSDREIGFRPARVMMVDSSGIPLMGDLAAMRDAMAGLGGDPRSINPAVPVDLIIDHSVIVDHAGSADALARNVRIEFDRNRERYRFVRWGEQTFSNLRVIPPGAGICHQVNLEHLATVVTTAGDIAYPDSLVGMDSHTPMIGSLGVVGWGVGGLEGGSAALGEPMSMLVPEVIGVRLTGRLKPGVTATDAVLTVTQTLRKEKLAGLFVEYCGPGVDALTLQDRSTLSNMTPEYGATVGYFPIDAETLRYLRVTGRSEPHVALVEAYAKAQGLWRDASTPIPDYTRLVEIDLATVEPSVAGPRRPHERRPLATVPDAFAAAFPPRPGPANAPGLGDGDIVIAAITSCTNTSNPAVMVGAGLLARNARARGLAPKPWVKTSLAPGSRVVAGYLAESGLQADLDALGFQIVGFGCTTCMGNSGPLPADVVSAIEAGGLATVAVLSGNRNFEGRVHTAVRANFIASPPLVVAYALAGSIRLNLATEPIGTGSDGRPVMLADIWPDDAEIRAIIGRHLVPELFRRRYEGVRDGSPEWRALDAPATDTWRWDDTSTFIRQPPFFENMPPAPEAPTDVAGARMLAMFGDMLTTDHISPIGAISPGTPAGEYLASLGVATADFGNYASRRTNHDVMIRGTFANIRLRNELTPEREGSWTRHVPSGDTVSIFDAAERYRHEGVPLVVVGGAEYGAGSSRDWAAKGSRLLGVRAILAESFERIHRSNLVGMGVLPLQFPPGVTRRTLGLRGDEQFDIAGIAAGLSPRKTLACTLRRADGTCETVPLTCRLDTDREVEYYLHGGILHHFLRSRLA